MQQLDGKGIVPDVNMGAAVVVVVAEEEEGSMEEVRETATSGHGR